MEHPNILRNYLLQLHTDELDTALATLSQRHSALYPDGEPSFLVLPKHDLEECPGAFIECWNMKKITDKKPTPVEVGFFISFTVQSNRSC